MRKEGDKMSGFCGGYGGCGEREREYVECERGGGRGSSFALIVVLFILLIIVGACFFQGREY
jgi:uncharacterized protein (TIGR01732 family)